jgi:hypothetical protein
MNSRSRICWPNLPSITKVRLNSRNLISIYTCVIIGLISKCHMVEGSISKVALSRNYFLLCDELPYCNNEHYVQFLK